LVDVRKVKKWWRLQKDKGPETAAARARVSKMVNGPGVDFGLIVSETDSRPLGYPGGGYFDRA
jgi:hypothetical protein